MNILQNRLAIPKTQRWILQLLCVIAMAFGWAGHAHAQCTVTSLTFPYNINYGAVTVPGNLAVGQPIPGTNRPFTITGSCAAYSYTYNVPVVSCPNSSAPVPGMPTIVFPTGIAGIGMQMLNSAGVPLDSSNANCDTGAALGPNPVGPTGAVNVRGSIQLVRTAAVVGGGALAPPYYYVGILNTPARFMPSNAQSYISLSGTITVSQTPTCTVTTPSIAVQLGKVPANTFTGIGTPSSAVPFAIDMQCAGGTPGLSTNIFVTLTDQTNPGNVSTTLSLAPSSTASGVGIQVLNGTTVLGYGPASSAPGNTNQWFAGSTGNGSFNIPLTARYVQTGSTVTPGSANGVAIFTMSYQ